MYIPGVLLGQETYPSPVGDYETGYIPPASSSGANTWYGINKDFWKLWEATQAGESTFSGEYNFDFIDFQNGHAISAFLGGEYTGGHVVTGYGWGITWEKWGMGSDEGQYVSSAVNPTTTAAREAIANAIMGVFASPVFYLRMLKLGYVYTGINPGDKNPHPMWRHEAWKCARDEFPILSYPFDNVKVTIFSNGKWNSSADSGINTVDYLNARVGEKRTLLEMTDAPERTIEIPVLGPSLYPSYGTDLSPFGFAGSVEYLEQEVTAESHTEIHPVQGNDDVPSWVGNWHSVRFGDSDPVKVFDISANADELALEAKKTAPTYVAVLNIIDDEVFISNFLVARGLAEHSPSLAATYMSSDQSSIKPPGIPGTDRITGPLTEGILGGATQQKIEDIQVGVSTWVDYFKNNSPAKTKKEEATAPKVVIPDEVEAKAVGATHFAFVKSSNFVKIRLRASKGGKIIGSLVNGDLLIVVDEFIGSSGEWHMIDVVEPGHELESYKKPLFVSSKDVKKFSFVPPSLPTVHRCKRKPKARLADWTKMEDKEMFFNKKTCEYCVVIEPTDKVTGKKTSSLKGNCDGKIEEKKARALVMGVEELLKFYNKATDVKKYYKSNIEQTPTYFQFALVKDDWFIEERPKSKLKMLVRIPAKYFDAIPEAPEDFEGIAHTATKLAALQSGVAEIAFEKDIPTLRTMHLLTATMSKKVSIAANLMKYYAEKMDNWGGEITGLDFNKEAERLKRFSIILSKFMSINKHPIDEKEEDTVELGFDGAFKLQYVLLNKTGAAAMPLRIGFERFTRKDPINISRTMGYVFYLDEITREAKKKVKISWIEFAQKYTFPAPAIRPSDMAKNSPMAASSKRSDKKGMAKRVAAEFDAEEVITSRGKVTQDKRLAKVSLKKELYNIRKKETDFVGDEVVRTIPDLIRKISSMSGDKEAIEELYTLVLNKIDIKEMASLASSAVSSQMPAADVRLSVAHSAMEEMGFDDIKRVYELLPAEAKSKVDQVVGADKNNQDLQGFTDKEIKKVKEVLKNELAEEEQYKKPTPSLLKKSMMANDIDAKKLGLIQKYGNSKLTNHDNKIKKAMMLLVKSNDIVEAVKTVKPDVENELKNILKAEDKGPIAPKLPSTPTMFVPDNLKIDDTMGDVTKDIARETEEIVADALLETTKFLLEEVFASLFTSAGTINAAKELGPSFGTKDLNNMFDLKQGGIAEAFKEIGVPTEIFLDIPGEFPENNPASEGTAKEMISDISAVLTPLEIVDLLEGNATRETVIIVRGVLSESYPTYMMHLTETTNIHDFFKTLGDFIDEDILGAVRKMARQFPKAISGLLCEGDHRFRESLLDDRFDKECVEKQLHDARIRRVKRLKSLLDLGKVDNLLGGVMPPPIGTCGKNVSSSDSNISNLSGMGGLIKRDHPSIDYLNDKVIKAIFDVPSTVFDSELGAYMASLLDRKEANPTSSDSQYVPLKNRVEKDLGFDDEKLKKAINGTLDDLEELSEFNEIVANFQKLDVSVAPKVKGNFANTSANFFSTPLTGLATTTSRQKISLEIINYTYGTQAQEAVEKAKKKLKAAEAELGGVNLISQQYSEIEGKVKAAKKNFEDKVQVQFGAINTETTKEVKKITAFYQNALATPGLGKTTLKDSYSFFMPKEAAAALGMQKEVNIKGDSSVLSIPEVSGYTFGGIASWQEEVFANYLIQRWVENSDFQFKALSSLGPSDNTIFQFYTKKQGPLFSAIVRILASAIVDSPLFDVDKLENIELVPDVNNVGKYSTCSTVSKVGLLDIEKTKRKVRELYDNSCSDPEQDPSKPGPLEAAGLQGMVYTILRVNVLEVILKSIFVFSFFDMRETFGDKLFTEFLAQSVTTNLKLQGKEYYSDFLQQAKEATDKRQQGGEKLVNPFTTQDPTSDVVEEDETLSEAAHPLTVSGKSSLRFLIKEQIKSLGGEIQERLKPEVDDIHSLFVSLIPTLNVAKNRITEEVEDVRFEDVEEAPAAGEVEGTTHALKKEFSFLSTSVNKGAGGFVLETYMRVTDKPKAVLVDIINNSQDVFLKEFTKAWVERPGGAQDVNNTQGESYHLAGAVNPEALLSFLSTLDNKFDAINLHDVLANFKFGTRMCYIPPVDGAHLSGEVGGFVEAGVDELDPDEIYGGKDGKDAIVTAAIVEKTFWLQENIKVKQEVLIGGTTGVKDVELKRNIYPVPLVSVEEGFGLDNLSELTIGSVKEILSSSVMPIPFNELKKMLIKTENYQFLFNYVFPLSRMLSLLAIYNVMSISKNVPGVENMFDGTKEAFKSMFFNLTPGDPWYSKQDARLESLGGNMGIAQMENGSMTIDGPLSSPSKRKIAQRAGTILLKGMAAMQDPNYKEMKKLDDKDIAPYGMTWGSVPILYPSNWIIPFTVIPGWGPPITPLGMVAYSLDLLPGEVKKKKKRKVDKDPEACDE